MERIAAAFPGCKVIDRRAKPRYGYRAVHLEVHVGGQPVEIQIRTSLQDEWAQAMEKLGDVFGRGVRYGEPVDTRVQAIVDALIRVADATSEYEEIWPVSSDPALAQDFRLFALREALWHPSRIPPALRIWWNRWRNDRYRRRETKKLVAALRGIRKGIEKLAD